MDLSFVDLGNLMVKNFWTLKYCLSDGCRCGSCYDFKFIDLDGKTAHAAMTVEELVRSAISASGDGSG